MSPEQLREQTIRFALAPPEERRRIIAAMTWQDLLEFDAHYERWTHEGQLAPKQEGWRTRLMLAGR
ncbi:MAG: hypothetical protein M3448_08290, partial [Pseudomonadota bacterium]|nr:hypothetical protein [Pseudomonadota bacterium]